MKAELTRIEIVMAEVKEKIATVIYMPGTRLPSVRAAAKTNGFSASTVVEAYERLQTQGIIYSRPGAGFYVADSIAPLSLADIGPNLDRAVDPLWISRQALEPADDILKPGCGWLPPDWLYEQGMRRGLKTVARADAKVMSEYATPLGLLELRQLLTRRMAGLGIEAEPAQVILTDSGTQAIDLIFRFLLTLGDTVVVDDPCYFNFHALLKAHRVKVVGVPYTATGPDVTAFAAILAEHKPRLYITNAAIHNPTGATLSPATAYQVLQLAQAAGLYLVEDDIFADFETTPAPRLAALDGLSQVFYIGSFSKTLSASLRCGYIAAPKEWVESLLDLKIATGFGGSQLAAAVVLSALTDSGYRKHMNTVHTRLAKARAQTVPRLAKLGIVPWLIPQAGMFLWCQLPDDNSAAELATHCLVQGVVLAPGNAFSQAQNAQNFMRFNVAQASDARIYEVLAGALN
ncbi:PLP-dependent aminotransferase family protein [Psychrobacter sp. TAE2020]|uniref:aminotransferase-like domain-containing protein n=1 Tax=Psychrobacter sp. TAE2020 TaxID=2846762 RepID=UPI001C10393F|nr:PLP-dependent aminotransferase family protein [Psychrobacter sp. TAE2020]MBU5616079.1 PLP-dependent aminotransferase family protein [Psychrobacter sp. TAE2020]